MSSAPAQLPGLAFEAIRPPADESVLRTDVAMFVGMSRRGPIGAAVRIDGWRSFTALFGGLWLDAAAPYSVKGYFDNGGDVGWFWRLGDPATTLAAAAKWTIGTSAEAAMLGFAGREFIITASSAGEWGNRLSVNIRLQRRSQGPQRIDITVTSPDELVERLRGVIVDDDLADTVAAQSNLVRLVPNSPGPVPVPNTPSGALVRTWDVQLAGGTEPVADRPAYDAAIAGAALNDESALFALPDLAASLKDDDQRRDIIAGASRLFAETLDRLLVADLPETIDTSADADQWLSGFGDRETMLRTVAAYHPWLAIRDELAPAAAPPRKQPPSGHVLGVISRLDRDRGAMSTPANGSVDGAIDLSRTIAPDDQGGLYALGINPVVCQSGRGLVVWGGRTLGGSGDALSVGAGFVAHRRLIHRLVRGIRQAARPLVFENNGPVLWYALARAATTILVEAWRTRALKGLTPDEAFKVRCDETLNSSEVIERGQVICEISIAPAAPMEFITIRVALGADGKLEVAEQ